MNGSPHGALQIVVGAIFCCLYVVSATCRAESDASNPPTVRQLMDLRGATDEVWATFRDGQPLDAQLMPLARVIYAVDRLPSGAIRSARSEESLAKFIDEPSAHRGRWLSLSGHLESIIAVEMPTDLAERFEFNRYFRCVIRRTDSHEMLVVCTTTVPPQWDRGPPSDQRVSCDGCFVALVNNKSEPPLPAFVAPRLAWHETNILGDLGMDSGLFATVKDRSPLRSEERDAFYELLAAAARAGTQELLRRTAGQSTDIVPLFNRPAEMRGQLAVIEGRARRAIPIRIEDKSIVQRYGFDHYWEVEIFTEESQGNPLVVCVLQLPEGMPRGDRINEPVRVPAFFFKSWSYQAPGAGEGRLQLAPLLIGREPAWLAVPTPTTNPYLAMIAGGCFTVMLAGIWFMLWRVGRRDERFRRQTLVKKYERAPDAELGPFDIAESSEPPGRADP